MVKIQFYIELILMHLNVIQVRDDPRTSGSLYITDSEHPASKNFSQYLARKTPPRSCLEEIAVR